MKRKLPFPNKWNKKTFYRAASGAVSKKTAPSSTYRSGASGFSARQRRRAPHLSGLLRGDNRRENPCEEEIALAHENVKKCKPRILKGFDQECSVKSSFNSKKVRLGMW
ncbi:hypothetical protein ACQFN5_25765 [Klebsiella sp. WOUb02]|uniref:hypothetical protein n=1 Tax=Klebsiella sp. WOUb02 TaxID=3161071 RepID=UPI003CF1CC40